MTSVCFDNFKNFDMNDLIINMGDFVEDLKDMIQTTYFNDGQILEIRQPKDVDYINPKLIFRDVLTDFVVKDYILNDTENVLIDIINKIMKQLFKAYKEITNIELRFVYRGGNILNIYERSYADSLPKMAREILENEFNQFFKKSDLDFFVVTKNHLNMNKSLLDTINMDVQSMANYGLSVARDIILSTPYIFKFCQYNKEYLDLIFSKVLKEINQDIQNSPLNYVKQNKYIGIGFNRYFYNESKINPYNIPANKQEFVFDDGQKSVYNNFRKHKKSGKYDLIINTDHETGLIKVTRQNYLTQNLFFDYDFGDLNKEIAKKNNDYMDLYISNNLSIYDDVAQISFRLSRIMINFTLLYKTPNNKYGLVNVPSELYDVSIGNYGDRAMKIFPFSAFQEYHYMANNQMDYIYIPTIETLIKDLDIILFSEPVIYPWIDPKYKKRLFRLIIMIFIETLHEKDIYTTRNIILKLLDNQPMKRTENKINFAYLQHKINYLGQKIINKPEYKNDYDQFLTYIYEALNKLLNVVEKYKEYVLRKGKIEELI